MAFEDCVEVLLRNNEFFIGDNVFIVLDDVLIPFFLGVEIREVGFIIVVEELVDLADVGVD